MILDYDGDSAKVKGVEGHRKEDDFLFGSVSAAKYQEFAVIKINKRGKRQYRVLGIDGNNTYNIKNSNVKDEVSANTFYQSNIASL
jgi:hypothetical protein